MKHILHKTKRAFTKKAIAGTGLLMLIAALLLSAFTNRDPNDLEVNAGDDIYLNCTHEPFTSVTLNGTATNYLYVLWETDGDGYFYDETSLNTEYYFGSEDLESEVVNLTLTAYGNYGVSESDDLGIYFPKQLIHMEPYFFFLDSIDGWTDIETIDTISPFTQNDTTIYDTIWNWVEYDGGYHADSMAISTYFDFSGKTIGEVLAPIGDTMFTKVYDANGLVNLNDFWDSRSAYCIKVKDTCCLGIYEGTPVFDRRFEFKQGNSYYLPVLSEIPINLTSLFGDSIGSPIEHLFRIDDFQGNTTYPEFDALTGKVIDSLLKIKELLPGKGYEITVDNDIEIVFPGHIDLVCPEDFFLDSDTSILLAGGEPDSLEFWYDGPGIDTTINGEYYFSSATDSTSFGSFPLTYNVIHPTTGTIGACSFNANVGISCAQDTVVEIGSNFILNKALPAGGSYAGNGVYESSGEYYFNSLEAEWGYNEITYTLTQGSDTGICNFEIGVKPIHFEYKDTVICFNEKV